MKRGRYRLVAAVILGVFLAGIVILSAGIIYLDMRRPDGFVQKIQEKVAEKVFELKTSLAGWFDSSPESAAPFQVVGPRQEAMMTALLPLSLETYSLDGVPHCDFLQVGAIERFGDGLVFGSCSGRFFHLTLGPDPTIAELPVSLALGADEMRTFVGDRALLDATTVTINDLLALDDGRYAVNYTQWDGERECVALRVATIDFKVGQSSLRTHFEATPCIKLFLDGTRAIAGHQAGGRLVQTGPETVMVTVGDFEFDGVTRKPDLVQDPSSTIGKIVEINLSTDASRVVSSGHRNPQGLTRLNDGQIMETEHGPQGGDELNVIHDGMNYGWPFETLGVQYGGQNWPLAETRGRHDKYEEPLFAWLPSIGISQLIQLEGFDPIWDGDILVNSMAIHTLYRLRLVGARVLYSEALVMKDRLRDIIQDAKGRVIILTDSYKVIAIDPDADPLSAMLEEVPEGVRRTMTTCLECHSLSANGAQAGRIPLAGVVGRDIASWPGVAYSDELLALSGHWDRERLDAFLADPSVATPNSAMAENAVEDVQLRGELLDLLQQMSSN